MLYPSENFVAESLISAAETGATVFSPGFVILECKAGTDSGANNALSELPVKAEGGGEEAEVSCGDTLGPEVYISETGGEDGGGNQGGAD